MIRRLRSLGFGVHSPFAFRFIREVICEQLPYYDYERLPMPFQRLAYRVAAFLQPTEIVSIGNASIKAPKLACPKKSKNRCQAPSWACLPPMPLYVANDKADINALKEVVKRGESVLIVDGISPSNLKGLYDLSNHCMIFENGNSIAVIVSESHLPKQFFKLKF